MEKDVTITITAVGSLASGKTRAIDAMAAALKEAGFEISAGTPRQQLYCVEVYTFKARLSQ